jgi:hypothetical protein
METVNGKKVFILMKNQRQYNGNVLGEDNFFIEILDKFRRPTRLAKCDISIIQEVEK